MLYRQLALAVVAMVVGPVVSAPAAHADNKRLNDGVVADVYTIQHHAGCSNDVTINLQLQSAAQRQALDGLNDRTLDGDIGSDGSTVQDRATAAGYRGRVSETVAINPAVAISGIELINQWYYNPADLAVMSDCANTQIGVWSENSLDRTVVVAVYGAPEHAPATAPNGSQAGPAPALALSQDTPIDPSPDYDASDEVEYGVNWLAWILRGVYPPPAYPPQ
ncbi:MAG: hypothetical protein QOF66_7044 [Mycobacterium sp.]|uniref:CAP domain-containing protein n=1 Tax=Mycobacterium sp. TaxID=1785 RepID=UPI0028B8629D|nr:hypothetical protein [Mycobacterium sp.]